MDRQLAEQKAAELLKQVVDALADKRYEDIPRLAELENWNPKMLREHVEEHLRLCGLSRMDPWTEERVTSPTNPCYQQLNFYHFNNGSGFAVDYDLTTDGERNDLTLQMEFFYEGGGLRAVLTDLHVM